MAASSKKSTAKAAAAVKADPTLVLLTAVEPIRYNGEDVQPDQVFPCDPDTADALLASGAAKVADAE